MIDLDHVVHAVHDLEATAMTYADLGFVVTPRADHPFGTSNRLVVLEDSYIEIVAVTDPMGLSGGFAPVVATFLAERGEGIPFVVLATPDAAVEHRRLHGLGVAGGEPFVFSRPAPQVDGTSATASFTTVFLKETPFPRAFFCAHHTPEAIWNAPALAHSNQVRRIDSIEIPETERILQIARDGQVAVEAGSPRIRFDPPLTTTEMNGIRLG